MRLTEILHPGCVKIPLDATEKQEAIFELVDLICQRAGIRSSDQLRAAVWQREMTRTTGIGHGIAIPHGKHTDCSELCLAIGKPAEPIDFDSVDGRPVDLIFLLTSPQNQTGPHVQALAQISRLWTDSDLRASLNGAKSADELYQRIKDYETRE